MQAFALSTQLLNTKVAWGFKIIIGSVRRQKVDLIMYTFYLCFLFGLNPVWFLHGCMTKPFNGASFKSVYFSFSYNIRTSKYPELYTQTFTADLLCNLQKMLYSIVLLDVVLIIFFPVVFLIFLRTRKTVFF